MCLEGLKGWITVYGCSLTWRQGDELFEVEEALFTRRSLELKNIDHFVQSTQGHTQLVADFSSEELHLMPPTTDSQISIP